MGLTPMFLIVILRNVNSISGAVARDTKPGSDVKKYQHIHCTQDKNPYLNEWLESNQACISILSSRRQPETGSPVSLTLKNEEQN